MQNIFFNVPARRKFLKSNSTELNNILAAFERIALVNPQISFTFHSNGTELFNLKACGIRQRIVDIFGKKINHDLLPVNVSTTVCNISGFVGKPESARKKGAHQYFFVNGRYMKHPYFHKAVMSSFERLLPVGEQVPYFIYFDVPPQDIDVNIHPTKTEIKFENEQTIWQILSASVKEAVGKFNDVPAIDFDTEGRPDIPVFDTTRTGGISAPKVSYNAQYNPFKDTPRQPAVPDNWESLYPEAFQQKEEISQPELFGVDAEAEHASPMIEDKSPEHYQYKGKYIMTAVKSGLMIIDQHRAHVRILYDSYIRQMQSRTGSTQKILFPEMVQFAMSDAVILDKILPEMTTLGFDIVSLGGGSYAVNGLPAGLDGVNVTTLVKDIVTEASENGVSLGEEINHSLALGLARNASIPYGQVLSGAEMEELVNELFVCSNVNYTPDGKTILAILSQPDIEQMLG